MTSCFHIMKGIGRNQRRHVCFIQLARWQHHWTSDNVAWSRSPSGAVPGEKPAVSHCLLFCKGERWLRLTGEACMVLMVCVQLVFLNGLEQSREFWAPTATDGSDDAADDDNEQLHDVIVAAVHLTYLQLLHVVCILISCFWNMLMWLHVGQRILGKSASHAVPLFAAYATTETLDAFQCSG